MRKFSYRKHWKLGEVDTGAGATYLEGIFLQVRYLERMLFDLTRVETCRSPMRLHADILLHVKVVRHSLRHLQHLYRAVHGTPSRCGQTHILQSENSHFSHVIEDEGP